jgi:hypothetical protein
MSEVVTGQLQGGPGRNLGIRSNGIEEQHKEIIRA